MRAAFLVLALSLLGAEAPVAGPIEPAVIATDPAQHQVEECCKVCRKGKACGDTCIARDKECHKPPGCACDG